MAKDGAWRRTLARGAIGLIGLAVFAADGPGGVEAADAAASASAMTATVRCQLPGQVRRMGSTTFLARGQIVRTSALHCAQRGGQVVGDDATGGDGMPDVEEAAGSSGGAAVAEDGSPPTGSD